MRPHLGAHHSASYNLQSKGRDSALPNETDRKSLMSSNLLSKASDESSEPARAFQGILGGEVHTATCRFLPQVCRLRRKHSFQIAIVRHHWYGEQLQLLLINKDLSDLSFSSPKWRIPTGTCKCVSTPKGSMHFETFQNVHLSVSKFCTWARHRITRNQLDYIVLVENNGQYETQLCQRQIAETFGLGSRWISLREIPGLSVGKTSARKMQTILQYAEWRVAQGDEMFWERWMFWRSDRPWRNPPREIHNVSAVSKDKERQISPDRWMLVAQ